MEKTTYNRAVKDSTHYYTMASMELVRDERLNATELGIMIRLLSNDDSYQINKTVEQKKSRLGRQAFNKAWKHLEELGYIKSKKIMKARGGSEYHYTINELVDDTPQLPDTHGGSLLSPPKEVADINESLLNDSRFNDSPFIDSRKPDTKEVSIEEVSTISIITKNTNTTEFHSGCELAENEQLVYDMLKEFNRDVLLYDGVDKWKPNEDDKAKLQVLCLRYDIVDEIPSELEEVLDYIGDTLMGYQYLSVSGFYKLIDKVTEEMYRY